MQKNSVVQNQNHASKNSLVYDNKQAFEKQKIKQNLFYKLFLGGNIFYHLKNASKSCEKYIHYNIYKHKKKHSF